MWRGIVTAVILHVCSRWPYFVTALTLRTKNQVHTGYEANWVSKPVWTLSGRNLLPFRKLNHDSLMLQLSFTSGTQVQITRPARFMIIGVICLAAPRQAYKLPTFLSRVLLPTPCHMQLHTFNILSTQLPNIRTAWECARFSFIHKRKCTTFVLKLQEKPTVYGRHFI
jgi:hypothetical protein